MWVTRPRPGVDRVMSAWLIQNLIDPKARFYFASENKKPTDAVPYDICTKVGSVTVAKTAHLKRF